MMCGFFKLLRQTGRRLSTYARNHREPGSRHRDFHPSAPARIERLPPMSSETSNSFASRATLTSGNKSYTIFRLPALSAQGFDLTRLPFSLKILLENLLRREDGVN